MEKKELELFKKKIAMKEYSHRVLFIGEDFENHETDTEDIFILDKYKNIKIISDCSMEINNVSLALLKISKTYDGSINSERNVLLTVDDKEINIDLRNYRLLIYPKDEDTLCIQFNKVDPNIINILNDNDQEMEYPYIGYNIKNTGISSVIEFILYPSVSDLPRNICTVNCENIYALIESLHKYYKLFMKNIDFINQIFLLEPDKELTLISKCSIYKVKNINGNIVISKLLVKEDKILFESLNKSIINLIEDNFIIADKEYLYYYEKVLIDSDFDISNDHLENVDTFISLFENMYSLYKIPFNKENKDIIDPIIKIISTKMKMFKDSIYDKKDIIIFYNGNIYPSKYLLKNTNNLIEEYNKIK